LHTDCSAGAAYTVREQDRLNEEVKTWCENCDLNMLRGWPTSGFSLPFYQVRNTYTRHTNRWTL